MRRRRAGLLTLLCCTALLLSCSNRDQPPEGKSPPPAAAQRQPPSSLLPEREGVIGRRELDRQRPVRIRLKRDGKDAYSWELSGEDVNEVLRTDRLLRGQLLERRQRPEKEVKAGE